MSSNSASGAGASETSLQQHIAQRLVANPRDMRSAEHGDDLIDEAKIVLGKDAEAVAGA